MQIIYVTDQDKNYWNRFILSNAGSGGLLQSYQWSEFQKMLDNKIFRLALVDDAGELQAAALLVRHELPFEYNYLYCPRGPIVKSNDKKNLKALFTEIKKIAQAEKSFMIRVDPAWPVGNEKFLLDVGLRRSDYEVQPKCSFVIDIAPAEDILLASFKPKTRYNINLAQRRGVKIRPSTEPAEIESFWRLLKQTADRDHFHTHLKEHYLKLFEILVKENMAQLFFAEYDNKIVAANFVTFFGQFATYLHGGSADMYREAMATYLLQWQGILAAKQRGCVYYDFGGINGKTYQNDKWAGITRFKTGFGPEVAIQEYVGGFELILNPVVFAAYKFIKQIRG
ncbi:MAG: hypothetical protein A2744_00535 [Candidatus Buchananbacteria bacterium RIFCSPHIGHO2_01_FULL_44_11]|uniref:BioF2-like acetyltransferase domain-containing protein n=1 Tax=Candidatus Buchananbacteria bacterium RIFCSPHIGHO2_01_FULL_44_11 TaxID=1797535 RepID=A0A1G1Y2A0_9BACT|nr:MAG: hypothetical protein A2744_00535 [Candidatus Buchananbacteria bacterium RIFCSPHIGHO2_01_FULL_44_11]